MCKKQNKGTFIITAGALLSRNALARQAAREIESHVTQRNVSLCADGFEIRIMPLKT